MSGNDPLDLNTIWDFLWRPDIVKPATNIFQTLLNTARYILVPIVTMFLLITYYGFVQEQRKTGATFGFALVAPAVGFLVAGVIGLLFLLLFGSFIAPIIINDFPILTMYPNTCSPTHPELHGALCYKPCPADRHRVSDVCWADTQENGAGTPVGLEPCPDGWNNWGLICQHPISCGLKDGWLLQCTGGELVGRLDHGGVCPGPEDAGGLPQFDEWYKRWKSAFDKKAPTKVCSKDPEGIHNGERTCEEDKFVRTAVHTERVDGMCYKPCPKGMAHVPLMPYLCVKTDADGKPMRLDYYDSDSQVPSMIQLFGRYNPI
jgi:hypothetical protein